MFVALVTVHCCNLCSACDGLHVEAFVLSQGTVQGLIFHLSAKHTRSRSLEVWTPEEHAVSYYLLFPPMLGSNVVFISI